MIKNNDLLYKDKINDLGYEVKAEYRKSYGTGYANVLSTVVNGRAIRSNKGYEDLYKSIIKRLKKEEGERK